ncbi:MAG: hypothetical protein LBG11_07590 [Bifidobacteriaceae bacterium]|jgi:hypothetical protein|nr:hypothetical protein [Bifidobacteriaceae bacterium]
MEGAALPGLHTTHLSLDERVQIKKCLDAGKSIHQLISFELVEGESVRSIVYRLATSNRWPSARGDKPVRGTL